MEQEKPRTWYVLSQNKFTPKNSGAKKQPLQKLGPWTLQEVESQLQAREIEPSDWITPESKPDFDKLTQTVVDLLKSSADPAYNLLDTIQFARKRQKDIFSALSHETVFVEFDLKKYLWIGFAVIITLIGAIKIFFTPPSTPPQIALENSLKEQTLEAPTVRETAPKITPSLFLPSRPATPAPIPPTPSLPRINMSSMPKQPTPRVDPKSDTYTPDERDELSNKQREPANNNDNNTNDDSYRTDIDPSGNPADSPPDDPGNIFY